MWWALLGFLALKLPAAPGLHALAGVFLALVVLAAVLCPAQRFAAGRRARSAASPSPHDAWNHGRTGPSGTVRTTVPRRRKGPSTACRHRPCAWPTRAGTRTSRRASPNRAAPVVASPSSRWARARPPDSVPCSCSAVPSGALAPATGVSAAELAAWTWAPDVLCVLQQLLTAQPSAGRSLVRPSDEVVLGTLPVGRGSAPSRGVRPFRPPSRPGRRSAPDLAAAAARPSHRRRWHGPAAAAQHARGCRVSRGAPRSNWTPPRQINSTALAGLFTAVALVTTGEAMQVAGIEADRGCRDALRRSPGPTGVLPAAKAVASALTVLASTAPFCLGAAALCGVPRRAVAGRRPAAGDRRRRGELLRRRDLVPGPRHRGVHRRARRTAPDGDVVEGVVTAVLMLPGRRRGAAHRRAVGRRGRCPPSGRP